jgi:hypothetical protein
MNRTMSKQGGRVPFKVRGARPAAGPLAAARARAPPMSGLADRCPSRRPRAPIAASAGGRQAEPRRQARLRRGCRDRARRGQQRHRAAPAHAPRAQGRGRGEAPRVDDEAGRPLHEGAHRRRPTGAASAPGPRICDPQLPLRAAPARRASGRAALPAPAPGAARARNQQPQQPATSVLPPPLPTGLPGPVQEAQDLPRALRERGPGRGDLPAAVGGLQARRRDPLLRHPDPPARCARAPRAAPLHRLGPGCPPGWRCCWARCSCSCCWCCCWARLWPATARRPQHPSWPASSGAADPLPPAVPHPPSPATRKA